MQVERPYLWDRHVTLKSFWRLLLQGTRWADVGARDGALCRQRAAGRRLRLRVRSGSCAARRGDEMSRDRIISITILSMPLLMPFYFDYDLLLLAVPAVLAARERCAR